MLRHLVSGAFAGGLGPKPPQAPGVSGRTRISSLNSMLCSTRPLVRESFRRAGGRGRSERSQISLPHCPHDQHTQDSAFRPDIGPFWTEMLITDSASADVPNFIHGIDRPLSITPWTLEPCGRSERKKHCSTSIYYILLSKWLSDTLLRKPTSDDPIPIARSVS